MIKPGETPEYIFDLMAEKAFEELSPSETEDVLKCMTEEEYRENSTLVGDFQAVDSQLQFNEALPLQEKENKPNSPKRSFAFSYLQMAATVVVLIGLGVGFGQFFSSEPEVLPVVADVEKSEIKVSTPVFVNVTPVNVQAAEIQLERIEQVAEQVNKENGTSLEEDDYPEEFVISI